MRLTNALTGWGVVLLCCCGAVAAAEEDPDVPESAAAETLGTTIFGDQEQALGLYLMPWQEEAASDIDRPPQLLHLLPELGSAESAETRAVLYESINAYRHAQVGRR
jgi:hypothetical protein